MSASKRPPQHAQFIVADEVPWMSASPQMPQFSLEVIVIRLATSLHVLFSAIVASMVAIANSPPEPQAQALVVRERLALWRSLGARSDRPPCRLSRYFTSVVAFESRDAHRGLVADGA